ncbi:MAG: hypothetical protein FLDDKLPJ_02675 [Phycisphaerae bacterium]|nr:hypothetical protein [Phycisphaerae bacterium]
MSEPEGTEPSATIDLVDNFVLSAAQRSRLHNDLNARESLWAGLELLYAQTRRLEKQLVPQNLEGSISITWGNIPGVPLHILHQVACFFDWYSVSACNFVALTGWMAKMAILTAESDAEYRRRVIPVVLAHRNKIGAHTSRVWPMDDGIATQEASNFRQLALQNDRLVANAMVLSRTTRGQSSNSRELQPWSLTETHEQLRTRYVFRAPSPTAD